MISSDLDLDSGAPPAKKPRNDAESDEVDFSMASLAKGEVTKVSKQHSIERLLLYSTLVCF